MNNMGISSSYGLENHGLRNLKAANWNLPTAALIEQALMRHEGDLARDGALIVNTQPYTGRAPNDKFVVQNEDKETVPIWWGKINHPITTEHFRQIYHKMVAYLQGRDVFVEDMLAGAHPDHRLSIRVISERAWHALFSRNLFIRQPGDQLSTHVPDYTIIHCPGFQAQPDEDGTNSGAFVILDFNSRMILIGGTSYAGEIKKSIFTTLNYLLPLQGILPMHCSANVGKQGDVALFFGLSGTGKTTLSSDPDRRLIGDDEHGWADDGVFNFEGGCYAKTIRLREDFEPLIFAAAQRFGCVLENVIFDPVSRELKFDDGSITENCRAAYPLDFIPGYVESGYDGHPQNIFFLTADANGVLPPIARLTPEQAMYYFVSGYTSKLAGTEKGLGIEPQSTFSACFSAPFLPLHPNRYAKLLGEKIARHNVPVWLINTGWTGGSFGTGSRIHLPHTRAMVKAALNHQLDHVPFHQEPYFGLWIPQSCPDVPDEILEPIRTWQKPEAYQEKASILASKFKDNFTQYEK